MKAERPRSSPAPRWTARLALVTGGAAALVLLLFAGLHTIALLAVGLAGLVVTAAALWWTLVRTGLVRVLALGLALTTPVVVLALYGVAGLLWVALLSFALWGLAVFFGQSALSGGQRPPEEPGRPASAPRKAFLIMNPRSGGGKVDKFGLVERARALGAEVLVLDVSRHQDVAALARRAADEGADLLGVAGGDGTQALVAGVAAERDLPFLVICAGTRNHFALDLGLDREDPATCLNALTDGVEYRVDLGYISESRDGTGAPGSPVGERTFVNNASFGAYASVVQSPEYRDDKVRTTLALLPDLLTHHAGPRLTVRAGGTVMEQPQAVLVSNNPYRTDDPAGLDRRDRLDTGVLGVLGVRVENAAQAAGMLRGKRAPGLTTLTTGEVTVDADASSVPVGVDGEALTLSTPIRCRIASRALRVRVPRDRPGVPTARPAVRWRQVWRLALETGHGGPAARTA
ncbi:MAG: diacylglycerol kinase family protein [Frankia sp.]